MPEPFINYKIYGYNYSGTSALLTIVNDIFFNTIVYILVACICIIIHYLYIYKRILFKHKIKIRG